LISLASALWPHFLNFEGKWNLHACIFEKIAGCIPSKGPDTEAAYFNCGGPGGL
jgi:hypothetical protein